VCTKLNLRCDYNALGCGFSGNRVEMQAHQQERAGYHAQLVSKTMKIAKNDAEKIRNDLTFYQYFEMSWSIPKSKIPRSGSAIIKSQSLEVTDGLNVFLQIAIDADDGVKFGICAKPTGIGGRTASLSVQIRELYVSMALYKGHVYMTSISLVHEERKNMSWIAAGRHYLLEEVLTRHKVNRVVDESAEVDYEETDEIIPVTRSDLRKSTLESSFEIEAAFKISKFLKAEVGCV
jgi:hypothetical protein